MEIWEVKSPSSNHAAPVWRNPKSLPGCVTPSAVLRVFRHRPSGWGLTAKGVWPAAAGTLHPGGGGVEWVKTGRWRVSLNRTWLSIGHVARVSPAPLSRDNQAACFCDWSPW